MTPTIPRKWRRSEKSVWLPRRSRTSVRSRSTKPCPTISGRIDRTMSNTLYERDFHAWANQQAALLRAGQLSDADIENIAEEIESIGRTQRSELVNRLIVLLVHLMKWRWQPGLRGASWRLIVKEQRRALRRC